MSVEGEVARHYTQSDLTRTVLDALRTAGKDVEALDPADLSAVDEFHTGWGPQTVAMAKTLDLAPSLRVLDVGSGIGGPARYFARAYGCDVTGIDLTPAFVELATNLTARTGLADRVRFVEGSALALPFEAGRFDLATMNHVGMNLADKPTVFAEVRRVLRPGGRFVVYDLMRTGDAPLPMPMPWADTEATSFVETPARYRELLAAAGFTVARERDWTDLRPRDRRRDAGPDREGGDAGPRRPPAARTHGPRAAGPRDRRDPRRRHRPDRDRRRRRLSVRSAPGGCRTPARRPHRRRARPPCRRNSPSPVEQAKPAPSRRHAADVARPRPPPPPRRCRGRRPASARRAAR